MNLRIAAAALSVLFGTGCVVVASGGNRAGDITLLWSFDTKTCSQAGVSSVQVIIPGENLANDGVFNCTTDGVAGITLRNFAGGTYSFTVDGFDISNRKLYSASGTFTINGNATKSVDLTLVAGPNSYAYLTWTFPAFNGQNNPSCATVGVTEVDIYIDNLAPTTVSCATGQSAGGATTPYLNAGAHTLTLSAVTNTGFELYHFTGSFTTVTGAPSSQGFTMAWSVGGVQVKWTLTDSVVIDCGQAGVADVYVNFRDSQNNLLYGTMGTPIPCTTLQTEFKLHPGTYQVIIQASGTGNRLYQSSMANPPAVTVNAGVFPSAAAPLNVSVPRTM